MEYAKKIGITTIASCTFAGIILIPLQDFQMLLWQVATLTTLIGDSATTALIGRFGMEEQHGYTRKLCGTQPSLLCSFLTRGLILVLAGGVWVIVSKFGIGVNIQMVALSVLSIPLILAIAGSFATLWNIHGFYTAWHSTESRV